MNLFILTTITMIAFAGNSILCRLALDTYNMDPASFTSIRLISGALALWALTFGKSNLSNRGKNKGDWISAFTLFTYAACFSFAYVNLSTAMGALLLFGAVQVTMVSYSLLNREPITGLQVTGLILSILGFGYLLSPGLTAPPVYAASIMIISGITWGIYSLRGQGAGNPTQVSADNFLRSIPFAIILSVLSFTVFQQREVSTEFIIPTTMIAVISGAVTSGLGYALWYRVLPSLGSTKAASVQLSVPVIAVFAGVLFLNESMNLRLGIASLTILGGVALVIIDKKSTRPTKLFYRPSE